MQPKPVFRAPAVGAPARRGARPGSAEPEAVGKPQPRRPAALDAAWGSESTGIRAAYVPSNTLSRPAMNSSSSCVSPSFASGEKHTVRPLPFPCPSSNLGEGRSPPPASNHNCSGCLLLLHQPGTAWQRWEGGMGGLHVLTGADHCTAQNNPSQTSPSAASPWVGACLWDYSPRLHPAAEGIRTAALKLSGSGVPHSHGASGQL